MWYELFVITASGLGVSIFLIYLLAAQIMPFLRALPMTLIETVKQEFNLTSSGAGGRPPGGEGFLDKILAIPGVQSYIGSMLKNMGPGQGGMGGVIGP